MGVVRCKKKREKICTDTQMVIATKTLNWPSGPIQSKPSLHFGFPNNQIALCFCEPTTKLVSDSLTNKPHWPLLWISIIWVFACDGIVVFADIWLKKDILFKLWHGVKSGKKWNKGFILSLLAKLVAWGFPLVCKILLGKLSSSLVDLPMTMTFSGIAIFKCCFLFNFFFDPIGLGLSEVPSWQYMINNNLLPIRLG